MSRLERAIEHLANHAPFDLMSPHEIQKRLLQILGEPHTHKASIGSDMCDICLRDLRDDIHLKLVDPKLPK